MIKLLAWVVMGVGVSLIYLHTDNYLMSGIGCALLVVKILPKR